MGVLSSLFGFWSSWSSGNAPPKPTVTPKKRRGDDISCSESKVRRLEDSTTYGEIYTREYVQQINQRETNLIQRNPVKVGAVLLSKWHHNGKENHIQHLPSLRSVNNSTMGHCLKANMDEIQLLEDCNRSSNFSKRGRNNLNLVDAPHFNADNSNGSDVEILELSPPIQSAFGKKEVEVVKVIQSSQARRKDDEIQVVNDHRSSAIKEGRAHRSTPIARKPFKAIDPTAQATSTPMLFTSRHSPEQPEVEIIQPRNLTNGRDSCRYRSQSSIFSSDSSSSRKSSTLHYMKRAEGNERYVEILKQFGRDVRSPQRTLAIQDASTQLGIKPDRHPSSPISCLFKNRLHLNSPIDDRVRRGVNISPVVKDITPNPRINVSVERVQESEPSTSASRHQSDDADLQYLGQIDAPVNKVPEGYECPLDDILIKYKKMNTESFKQVGKQEESCKLLSERNGLADKYRDMKISEEITDQISAYFKLVEELETVEEEEKVPPLPELTDEMNAEINKALAAPPDAVLASAFNLTIKGRDMRTLKDLAWLNDEVINFYMNMIIERGKGDNYPSVHAFNTFFFPKLISSGYDTLKRWTKKVDVFSHDYLLVPVHRGMHWCMAIINMKEKVICYYDSMDGRFPQCMDALLNYLQKESLDKKKQPFDTTGWVKEHAEGIPQQNNGSDCGMFACMYAEYISRGAAITFTQENMPYFRRKAVYEILKAKLLC